MRHSLDLKGIIKQSNRNGCSACMIEKNVLLLHNLLLAVDALDVDGVEQCA